MPAGPGPGLDLDLEVHVLDFLDLARLLSLHRWTDYATVLVVADGDDAADVGVAVRLAVLCRIERTEEGKVGCSGLNDGSASA